MTPARRNILVVPAEDSELLGRVPSTEITILLADIIDGRTQLFDIDGASMDIDADDEIMAMVAFSSAGHASLSIVHNAMSYNMAGEVPPPLLARASASGPVHAVLASLSRQITEQAQELVLVVNALARLRREHERLQDSQALAEALLVQNDIAPPQLAFAQAPAQWLDLSSLRPSYTRLSQRLPVPVDGFAAIGLILRGSTERAFSDWIVSLHALEEGRLLGEWPLRQAHAQQAWQIFALNRAESSLAGTLELRLEQRNGGRDKDRVLLGLSGRPSNADYAAFKHVGDATPSSLEAGLAMRIWRKDPLMPVEPTEFTHPDALSIPISLTALKAIRPVYPPAAGGGRQYVHFIDHEAAIMCHPGRGEPTIACLGDVTIPQAEALVLEALVDHSQGHTIEFALTFAPDDRTAVLDFTGPVNGKDAEQRPRWLPVSYGVPRMMTLQMPKLAMPEQRSLYVATRISHDTSNEFAWAKLRNIRTVMRS